MIEGVALPGCGKGVADVSLEGAEGSLDSLIVRNQHNPVKVIRHGQHHQWRPLPAGSQVMGGGDDRLPCGGIIEV
ncbi:MAG: hypothetical protein FJ384_09275, partial [Verrucomicrobia bacterium]|nr:hypothetical protein [Verrucomicrobiota bacterium]